MTLAEQILIDARIFVNTDEMGELITYTPEQGDGTPISIPALVDQSFDIEAGSLIDTRRSVAILADVASNPATGDPWGVADPVAGDTAVIRGRTCRVEDVLPGPEVGMHDLQVEVGNPP